MLADAGNASKRERPSVSARHVIHGTLEFWTPIKRIPCAQLSVEPSFGAFERDGLYDSYDLDEPGRLYWLPSWLMHSGRNHSSDQERGFLLISQRFDDDTRRLQGSVGTPI
ncbi:MAG: hypothetical protein BMS9Abin01_0274 [Gammaproteobacteria bacterium]|nr:MAG: hypothetical protein BMS9Abin01_0274 [Gammaproteobacteria bacterium]